MIRQVAFWAVATVAFFSGTSLIACAQSGSATGTATTTPAARAGGTVPGIADDGSAVSNIGVQRQGASTGGSGSMATPPVSNGWPPPCPPPNARPYVSQPCVPVER